MAIVNVNSISGINSITAQSTSLNFYTAAGNTLSIGASVSGNIAGNVTGNLTGNVTGAINSTGVSTITTLNATSLVGVTTAGITTAYIGSVNDGPISGARNRIINGDMRMDQRNAGASVTPIDGQYTLDRYQSWLSQSSKFSVQRSATVPVGFTSSILITSLSALSVGVNDEHGITQKIEGNNISDLNWGTSDAKPVILSFWVRSSITGNFGGMVGNGSLTRIYPFTYSINATNTWEYKTISIAGETSGTWTKDETWGMAVHFQFGVGSNRSASAGAWVNGNTSIRGVTGQTNLLATNGATWNMTGLQLEPGTVATPFERRSYGQELALAQRYFCTSGGQTPGATSGKICFFTNSNNTSTSWGNVRFPVTMRATPSVTIYNDETGTQGGVVHNGVAYLTNVTASQITVNGFGALSFGSTNCPTGSNAISFSYVASIEL